MNKLLWIIIILLWILCASWICHHLLCGPVAGADNDGCDSISLSDGTLLDYNGKGNVKFLRSSDNLILTEGYHDNGLATVNNYLIKNQNRAVQITGLYEGSEKYSGTFTNLGEARANSIMQVFLKRGVRANQISIAGTSFSADCMSGDTLNQAARFQFSAVQ